MFFIDFEAHFVKSFLTQKSIWELILEGFWAPKLDLGGLFGRRYVRSTENFQRRNKAETAICP